MIKRSLLSGVAVAALLALSPAQFVPSLSLMPAAAQAQEARISVKVFFDQLQPHGRWVRSERYTYVWCPNVDADWVPYSHGRWRYLKDRGWYFQSSEPFAWVVYHYGRWYEDERLGWCWVPGTKWAPAWVVWRRGKEHIGWAPLPPEDRGYQVSFNIRVGDIRDDEWVFVPTRRFLEPELRVVVTLGRQQPDIVRQTEVVGPVVVQNNIVVNNVIEVNYIEQQTGQQVPVATAQPVADPAAATTADASGNATAEQVPVFAPEVEEPTGDAAPPQPLDPAQPEAQAPAGAGGDQPATPAAGDQPPADQQPAPAGDQPAPAGDQPAAPAATDQPATGGAAPADNAPATGAEAPAGDGAQPADQAAPAADKPADAAPTECPEGQTLQDGKCVAAKTDEAPAPAPAEQAPAADQTPATEQAPPAEQPAAEAPAADVPAADAPAADEAPAAEQAPSEQPAAEPAQDKPKAAAPAECPEGQQLVDGKCVAVEGGAEPAPAQ